MEKFVYIIKPTYAKDYVSSSRSLEIPRMQSYCSAAQSTTEQSSTNQLRCRQKRTF